MSFFNCGDRLGNPIEDFWRRILCVRGGRSKVPGGRHLIHASRVCLEFGELLSEIKVPPIVLGSHNLPNLEQLIESAECGRTIDDGG